MNIPSQVNTNQSGHSDYRRSTRLEEGSHPNRTVMRSTKVLRSHKIYLLLLSIVVSCLTVAVPLFSHLANGLQSQNLYIGEMCAKGQLPFTDMFATGGFLYYAVIALSYHLRSTAWLIPMQVLLFYISGIYFYKLVHYLTKNRQVAVTFSGIFYLMNVTLGFGGLYPMQFAMPFVMVSLWFLTKYFAGIIKDEAFILYGFAGAMAMLLEPHTLLFWGSSFVTILVYNLQQRHFARGFYQLLCILFGTILVFYTAGYFILNLQILSAYISQALVYPMTYLATGHGNVFLTLLFQVVLALGTGLLLGSLSFKTILQPAGDRVSKWLIFLVFLLFFLRALLSHSYASYQLLPSLPFGLLLTAMVIGAHYQERGSRRNHRRRRRREDNGCFGLYLKRHFYLPLLALLIGVGQPLVSTLLSAHVIAERSEIARYLKEHTTDDEAIYVWDDSAQIYLATGLASSSQFVLPNINTTKPSFQKLLEDELLQNQASYFVLRKGSKLSETLQQNLATSYTQESVSGLSDFTIYHKN